MLGKGNEDLGETYGGTSAERASSVPLFPPSVTNPLVTCVKNEGFEVKVVVVLDVLGALGSSVVGLSRTP